MKLRTRSRRFLLAAALTTVACSHGPLLHAANEGDRVALERGILVEEREGTLHLGDAAALSRAVVAHEIRTAPSEAYALERVHDLRACAFAVDGVLAERMRTVDPVGGAIALERVESGAVGEGAARAFLGHADDHFRAAGVWGLVRGRDHAARVRALKDGSMLVRRSALHAVVAANDAGEYGDLLEAARLDPDPLIRSAAVRALARLDGAPPDLANRLRDVWTGGDDGLREDVAAVYASALSFGHGGREALAHQLAVARGNEAVSLAGVVLGSNVDDATLRQTAVTALALSLNEGGHRERIHALAIAPLAPRGVATASARALLDAVRLSSRDDDLEVRLAALGRLATSHEGVPEGDRETAITALEALAAPAEVPSPRASRARLLLAEAGDLRAQGWIESDLRSPNALERIGAAEALAALGRVTRAVPLLADADPEVRTRVACTILLAESLRR